ncbi:protein secretion protein [Ornithinibacillus sp. L9]|uniref:peptidylprolyl isomerase n=1 Tax=Ornithinibacillus caprae TaxID=2678566 RepID=A0A6N8FFR7_9BACI|nr:peptidyl-prolyl cis-trans isomerase [Ornithinibacillus caprae]MUK88051.1 protein secretion protein [Ornithinibacillus caprae]
MSRRFLMALIAVLLITNIATLMLWTRSGPGEVVEDEASDMQIDTKKPVASIDGDEITYEAWMAALRDNYGQKQLKTMIDRTVVNKLADQQGITVHEKVINREIALLASMQGVMTEEETEKMEEKWRDEIIYRYQLEALLAEGINVSEDDMRAYYDQYHNQYNFTESIQFSHILVEDQETAEKVKGELDNGASFSLLAKEYSIDEDTRDAGGYFGYYTTNSQFLPNGYKEKASEMEEYSYSEPFLTDQGYAIMYLHRSMPEITFTYDELKPYIKNELALVSSEVSLVADSLWDTMEIDWLYNK